MLELINDKTTELNTYSKWQQLDEPYGNIVPLSSYIDLAEARSIRRPQANIFQYGPRKPVNILSLFTNKTQYDWFPGKSQNSKKFSANFKQNPTASKNHRVFLNILEC